MISQQDDDDAQAALAQAEANVAQQQADLETARINLGYTRIVAPIAGKISRSYLTQGALVEANQDQALATIQTLDPIYVDMNQSTGELLALKRALAGSQLANQPKDSAAVSLTLDDGTRYPLAGTLQFSEVAVDQTTGSVTLRAQFRTLRLVCCRACSSAQRSSQVSRRTHCSCRNAASRATTKATRLH